MEFNEKSQEWAKGFSKGASGQGQLGILKKFFSPKSEDEDHALENRKKRIEKASYSQGQDSQES